MASNGKKFGLDLELNEFIEIDDTYTSIPIYKNSEIYLSADDILATLKVFEKRVQEFIEAKLKNNGEGKNVK